MVASAKEAHMPHLRWGGMSGGGGERRRGPGASLGGSRYTEVSVSTGGRTATPGGRTPFDTGRLEKKVFVKNDVDTARNKCERQALYTCLK